MVGNGNGVGTSWDKEFDAIAYPPTAEQRRKFFGNNLIGLYCNIFNTRAYAPSMDLASFHTVLGQLPAIRNYRYLLQNNLIDCRIHTLLLQPSGTTKGPALGVAGELTEKLDMDFHMIASLTDNALTGTNQRVKEFDPKTKKEIYVDHIEYGLLDPRFQNGQGVSILACSEASLVLSRYPTKTSQRIMDYLQYTCNPIGAKDNLISKKIGYGEEIKFNPSCSLFLTSYPPEGIGNIIVSRGFIQRMITIVNDVSIDERESMAQRANKNLGRRIDTGGDLGDVANRFKIIDRFYKDHPGRPTIGTEARGAFDVVTRDLSGSLRRIKDSSSLENVSKFYNRYNSFVYNISIHHACVRLDTEVKAEDVMYAKDFILPIWQNIITFIESQVVEDDGPKRRRMKIYKSVVDMIGILVKDNIEGTAKDGWVALSYLTGQLEDVLNCSQASAYNYAQKMVNEGYLSSKKAGRNTWVKTRRKVKYTY